MNKVLKFLEEEKVGLFSNPQSVELFLDDDCDMAMVTVNGTPVMEGNTWDFYPGCHGFDLPDYRDPDEFVRVLVKGLNEASYEVRYAEHEYTYYEN